MITIPTIAYMQKVPSTWFTNVANRLNGIGDRGVYDTTAARDLDITAPTAGMSCVTLDTGTTWVYLSGRWIAQNRPHSAAVDTQQSSTLTAYGALATAGPAVTLATATQVLVTVAAQIAVAGADTALMGVAISGATTRAATDDQSAANALTAFVSVSSTFLMTGLTPGNNTFTAQYKTALGQNCSWRRRKITVVPL